MWTLTYSLAGAKEVLVIPSALVPLLRPLVERGRQYRNALTELLTLNAQLVRLWREEQRQRDAKRAHASHRKVTLR